MNILETKNLMKSFGGVHAIDRLSLAIPEGQIVGLVGPNGSGKTTFINLLSGFLKHDGGSILFSNAERGKVLPWENQIYGITRTFQQIRLFNQMSALDNILVILTERSPFLSLFERHSAYHIKKAEEILKIVDLYESKFKNAENLSYGQKKLLEIGRALAMDAKIILLDEPFAGLFPEIVKRVEEIIRKLKKEGKTIVLVEHNMNIIRNLCDYLVVMDAGKLLAEGYPEKVLADKMVLEAYLGE